MKKTALALVLCMLLALACACTQTRNDIAKMQETPQSTPEQAESTHTVTFSVNGRDCSVELPDSWDAQPVTLDDGQWGFTLTPKAQPQLSYDLMLYKQMQGFGVCGTGLEERKTVINGMDANLGYYDGADYWSFVSFDFDGMSGSLTWSFSGDGSVQELGISGYNDTAMAVLETLSHN